MDAANDLDRDNCPAAPVRVVSGGGLVLDDAPVMPDPVGWPAFWWAFYEWCLDKGFVEVVEA